MIVINSSHPDIFLFISQFIHIKCESNIVAVVDLPLNLAGEEQNQF